MIIKPDTPKTFKERFKKWIAKSIWDFLRSSGATNFPGSLDSYSTKSSGDTISEAHINDPQDAIEAIEAKVGTGASTPTDNNVLTGTGAGTSAWGKVELAAMVSGTLPVANSGVKIKTGTYTGDGAATKAITGVGFQPKFLTVWRNEARVGGHAFKSDQDGTYAFVHGDASTRWIEDEIISLDADGFTVGDAGYMNANGKVYTYVAFTF